MVKSLSEKGGKGGNGGWLSWLLLECAVGDGGPRGSSFRVTSAKESLSDCMMNT